MFSVTQRGSFDKFESYLRKMATYDPTPVLEAAGRKGVVALERSTPADSGLAKGSWTYTIERGSNFVKVVWHNMDIETGFPVALMLQYGYATGTGGYVAGRDYINPAIEPIFKQIEADIRKAVTSG